MSSPRLPLLCLLALGACESPDPGGTDLGGTDDLGADLAGPPPLRRPFDIVGFVGTGQSLSVGAKGTPLVSTSQPYGNLMLADPDFAGDLNAAPAPSAALAPLVEPIRAFNNRFPAGTNYPNNLNGETPHPGMANELTRLARAADGADYVSFHSAIGASGQSISVIKKGGTGNSYAAALYEAKAATALARKQGKRFGYGAVLLTHGETDWNLMTYGAEVLKLARDYDADLRAITGQTERVPLLVTQQATFPTAVGGSPSTLALWQAALDHPDEVVCVGPKYQYEYDGDRVHLSANGYRRLGQKYAQVYFQHAVQGRPFRPLQPRSVERGATDLLVTFDVPVPPLRWDDRMPAPHQGANHPWLRGRGFEVTDAQGPVGIASVAIEGEDKVRLVLARAPSVGMTLAYALTQDGAGAQGGLTGGRIGQLRDSDETVGYDEEAVPCAVTQGAKVIAATAANGFARRSLYDVVVGDGLARDTVVMARTAAQLTLSAPWTGASGMATVKVHNDLHNYAVQFSWTVR